MLCASDQTPARQRCRCLGLGKTTPLTAAVLKRALFKRPRMHSTAWRWGGGLEVDTHTTCEELGTFLPHQHLQNSPSSREILPKALHSPSDTGTAQGDALTSMALPCAAVAGSCSPVCEIRIPPSSPPLTLHKPLLEALSLSAFLAHLFSHPSWMCTACCELLSPCSPRCFRALSPTGCFQCKAMPEMGRGVCVCTLLRCAAAQTSCMQDRSLEYPKTR